MYSKNHNSGCNIHNSISALVHRQYNISAIDNYSCYTQVMSEGRSISTSLYNCIQLHNTGETFIDQFKYLTGRKWLPATLDYTTENLMSNMSMKGSNDETEGSVVSEKLNGISEDFSTCMCKLNL